LKSTKFIYIHGLDIISSYIDGNRMLNTKINFKHMDSILQDKDFKHKGFMLFPFPRKIKENILNFLIKKFKTKNIIELENFLSELDDNTYKNTFSKAKRIIGNRHVENDLFNFVKELFPTGSFINKVSEFEVKNGYGLNPENLDIQIRCARFRKGDVAPAHRDSQFWNMWSKTDRDPSVHKQYKLRTKIWIPLYGCTKLNSLQFLEGSHNDNIELGYKENIPFINLKYLKKNNDKFFSPFKDLDNECVIFHDDVVHRGVINNYTPVRISCEFTICS